jgi:hypothetical protein
LPPKEEGEDILLTASDNQAELMCWHYQLDHLSFPKLKQLALNGKNPKKLAKVLLPKCTGCLFGVMTKLPWQGKKTKADHEVLIATKPGEGISVDQIVSTEVEFYVQFKRKYHQEALQVHHRVCQPFQLSPHCSPSNQ